MMAKRKVNVHRKQLKVKTEYVTVNVKRPALSDDSDVEESDCDNQIHMKKEEAEKVECSICGEVLKNKQTLTKHRRKHGDKFSCSYCKFEIAWRTSMMRHSEKKHKKEHDIWLKQTKAYRKANPLYILPKKSTPRPRRTVLEKTIEERITKVLLEHDVSHPTRQPKERTPSIIPSHNKTASRNDIHDNDGDESEDIHMDVDAKENDEVQILKNLLDAERKLTEKLRLKENLLEEEIQVLQKEVQKTKDKADENEKEIVRLAFVESMQSQMHSREEQVFMNALESFGHKMGYPLIWVPPVVDQQKISLYNLFNAVQKRGYFRNVHHTGKWKIVAQEIGISSISDSGMDELNHIYTKRLLEFEELVGKKYGLDEYLGEIESLCASSHMMYEVDPAIRRAIPEEPSERDAFLKVILEKVIIRGPPAQYYPNVRPIIIDGANVCNTYQELFKDRPHTDFNIIKFKGLRRCVEYFKECVTCYGEPIVLLQMACGFTFDLVETKSEDLEWVKRNSFFQYTNSERDERNKIWITGDDDVALMVEAFKLGGAIVSNKYFHEFKMNVDGRNAYAIHDICDNRRLPYYFSWKGEFKLTETIKGKTTIEKTTFPRNSV